jgi:hypothetical protein
MASMADYGGSASVKIELNRHWTEFLAFYFTSRRDARPYELNAVQEASQQGPPRGRPTPCCLQDGTGLGDQHREFPRVVHVITLEELVDG